MYCTSDETTCSYFLQGSASILSYCLFEKQIPNGEINKVLSTEMNVLRRSAENQGWKEQKNEHTKEIIGVKGRTS
jgi:hypothetical protein